MKSILLSIKPKYVELIANGEKTIEVRKTMPKLETPFKAYIYCTKGKPTIFESDGLVNGDIPYFYNGYVMGEFVCNRIDEYANGEIALSHNTDKTCLTNCELADYIEGNKAYFWHITDLKIYDKPKELSEFWTVKCTNKRNGCMGCEVKPNCIKTITRPPQSWCYVEEL